MSSSPTQFVDVAAFLSWLAQRDHVELQAWVRTALRHNQTEPLTLTSKHDDAAVELIGDLFEESQDDDAFQNAVRSVLAQLVADLHADDPPHYALALFELSGELPVSKSYDRLLVLAADGFYRDLDNAGHDLHGALLGVLVGMAPASDERLHHILQRDIENSRYTAICFYALTRFDVSSYFLRYLPIVTTVGRTRPSDLDYSEVLRNAVEHTGPERCFELLFQILPTLGVDDQQFFMDTLLELHPLIRVPLDDATVSMRLKSNPRRELWQLRAAHPGLPNLPHLLVPRAELRRATRPSTG